MSIRSKKWMQLFTLLAAFLLQSLVTVAQQEISVRVQVNRLPNGAYPTKIYQFERMPGLVMVTITNRTNNSYTIYLTGTVTGDNGVKVTTAKNYQPGTIEVKPLETKVLNAIEAGKLFDPNYLVYTSGSTSIKSSVFGEQGLPEGSYQVCARAFNAANKAPLSDEEPLGCSNIFTITTLEPPMILNPFNESFILPDAVQNIPLRWTTPPGSPPSTEYQLRIVELFNNRNPNDAILSTPTPFFETTVRGTPLLLYSMQYPRLQEGRSYAMIVTASDPLGGATFRNNGRSEVIWFTYGKSPAGPGVAQGPGGQSGPVEYATHSLSGKLQFTFKKSEQGTHTVYNSPLYLPNVNQPQVNLDDKPYIPSFATTAFAAQLATTPMIKFNAVAAVNKDNTLSAYSNYAQYTGKSTPIKKLGKVSSSLPTNVLSAYPSTSNTCTYENIIPDSATERYPLGKLNITLSAVGAGSPRQLLGTAKTDEQGNFTFNFLHPSYGNTQPNITLELSVQATDFETTVFQLPGSVLAGKSSIDLGNFTLLARTYRFLPKCSFEESDDQTAGTYGVHIYREVTEMDERPYLMYEGQYSGTKRNVQTVDGRQVIEIATDSITLPSNEPSKLARVIYSIDVRGAGRLFFGGKLYMKLVPGSSSYYNINSEVNVLKVTVPSNKVLQARADYKFTTKPSHIEGTVAVYMEKSIPIEGATVRVMYRKTDKVPMPPRSYTLFPGIGTLVGNKTSSVNSYLNTFSNAVGKLSGAGKTSLTRGGSLSLAGLNVTPPVMVTPVANNANNNNVSNNNRSSGNLVAKLVLPIDLVTSLVDQVPADMEAITVTTDELGKYYISLPTLKPNSPVTVQVIGVPYEFRTFVIRSKTQTGENPVKLTAGKGVSRQVDFEVDADVADIVGRVVDDKGQPLANVQINYKGNTLTTSGPYGMFQFKLYPGNHTLSLEKEGYVIKTVPLDIPQQTNKGGSGNNNFKTQWAKMTVVQKQQATLDRISKSPTVQASIARGNTFSPTMFGIATSTKATGAAATEFNASLAIAFGMNVDKQSAQYEQPREFPLDVRDIGYLKKITGKIRFRVRDDVSKSGIEGVKISLFDTSHTTDPKGEWFYEGFGGAATVTILPPAGSTYAPEQRTYTLAETGEEAVITIDLKKGVAITGRVVSGTQPLPDANVYPDGKEFLGVRTDAQGKYTLYTTAGEHTISARISNYVGQDSTKTIPASGAVIQFNLKGNNGKNYAKLLGFDIELSAAEPIAGGQERWSGAFIKMKPISNDVFTVAGDLRIPFSNLVVSFSGANAVPAGPVKTDLTFLPVKLFGYLPAKLEGDDVVTITKTSDGNGELAGTIKADFAAIQGYRGWSLGDKATLLLAKTGASSPDKIIVFSSSSSKATIGDRYDLLPSGGNVGGKLYGFAITLNKGGVIDKDGIELKGSIATPAIGGIKTLNIGITRLFLNRSLAIGAVQVQTSDLPSLEIASWKASINNLIFNEDGFKVGGELGIEIPKSASSTISFANLSIASNGLFGGQFTIPESGIDLLSVANLNTDGVPLSFGRVGNSSVYRVGGKASLKINVGILEKAFKVPVFEVMTNGDFTVEVPANYSTTLGPFGFSVGNIYINTKDNIPYIGVQGSFKVDLDFLKFEMADIKVKSQGGTPTYSIEKIGVKLDVPVLTTEAFVVFKENGFEGGGSLDIKGTPVHAEASFKYYKRADGFDLGAHFFANIPRIPIGVVVTLDGIGGGFEYRKGGANGGFEVDIRGKISFVGTSEVVSVDPIGLTVSSAGILKGYGDVKVATYLKTAHAEVVFNGPDRTFTIQVKAEMSPLGGLASQSMQGALVISAKPDDEFAFLGCAVQVKLLGLVDNRGEAAVAIRLKDPKTRGGLIAPYFVNAPDEYVGNRFSGVYIDVGSRMGIPRDHPLEFDLLVVAAKLWCYSEYRAGLLLNFENNNYRIRFGGKFDAGAELRVLVVEGGLSTSLCYTVEGGRNDAQGWNFRATASGNASITLGVGDCDAGCNKVKVKILPPWDACGKVKLCGGAYLDFGFSERDGIWFKGRGGDSVPDCF